MNRTSKRILAWTTAILLAGPVATGQAIDAPLPIDSISATNLALPADSLFIDSIPADSLSINPLSTDSIPTDTIPPKSNAVDAPVHYAAKDSMVMVLKGENKVYLYGEGSVQYKNLDLSSEYIEVDANQNTVYATFALDSVGEEFGYPLFKEGEMQYEMKKARYNFKTEKMYINGVITQQGEGYMTAGETKKMPNDDLYARNARYTTCDDHEHPHFYFNMLKIKLRPGKDVVSGPLYLVVEDVPLPVFLPFAFFPFTSDYSSGIIMPTYGDELTRGFSLQNGGYYFALSDYIDLRLTGEIFTRGSWGLNAQSNYKKNYRFDGNFNANYRVTIMGEKDENDYSKTTDFRVSWSHTQNAKANPFGTFSANVNFATSSYNQNDLSTLYSPKATENTASSNISYNYRPPNSIFSFNANASINQIKRDTTLSVTLPNLTITMREVYPFQRKERVGAPRWYENIRLSYTGVMSNSIQNVKEYDILKKNLIGDWKNGMQHRIPISASFNLFNFITLTPNFNYEERWYTSRVNHKYDYNRNIDVPSDTTTGFYRIYNYNASLSAQTKLYGEYRPWTLFGKWTQKTVIRHVFTPNISFSGAPDFSDKKYGYYKDLPYMRDGQPQILTYSPYGHNMWGVPGRGQSASLNFDVDNNLEMKIPVASTDSTRKISLIDQFKLGTSYNFLADSLRWSDIRGTLRIKLTKNYSLSLSGVFDIYQYDEKGHRIDRLVWKDGRFPRFRGTSHTFDFQLNNETIKKWFSKGDKDDSTDASGDDANNEDPDALASDAETGAPARTSLRKPKEQDNNYDPDGYYMVNIPWNLSVHYSFGFTYDTNRFNTETRTYPYKINQSLGLSGNISPTKNWNITFNTGFDFDTKKFTTTQISISRLMHCWSMSASAIPVGPYQSYSFTIAVNSSLLQDVKYNQSNNYRDAMHWGY
jgi:hypothetical protein